MKALILEDEQLASNRLKRMLKEVAKDITIVAIFETIEETRIYLKHNDVDILFLDIHVGDGNSFELFDLEKISAKTIFTTAYDKYAIEAFRKNAVDYLLKPLKKSELIESIEKVTKVIPSKRVDDFKDFQSRITVNFLSKMNSIKVSDIAYIYSKDKISYLYLNNGEKYASDYKLQDLEKLLNPRLFFRANRQFIIHIDAIVELRRHQASRVKVSLNPPIEKELVISTEKTPTFKKWLER